MKNELKISMGPAFNLITVILIALKLENIIDWSWLLVLCPMIFTYSVAFVFQLMVSLSQIWYKSYKK